MEPKPEECFDSWAQELKSRSDRVRNLIGSAHWLSDGHHKEDILRQFLIRHLPPRLRITRGFMRSSEPSDGVSREIDAMVSDSEGELPWFAEGGLIIAPPSSVLAQVHVKTEFAARELADVLLSGAHNQQVFEATVSNRSLWFGAVFFSASGAKFPDQQKRIWRNAVEEAKKAGIDRTQLPDCVVIVEGPAFLPDKCASDTDARFSIRAYDCGEAAAAVFLSHLYDSIPLQGKDSTRRGEWFRMITHVCKGTLFTELI